MQARTALPTPSSLRQASLAAAAKGHGLVVMVTLDGCPYCEVVRSHHLLPLQSAGRLHAVQVDMRDRASQLEGFDGRQQSPAQWAKEWRAGVAPTLLFFGPSGQEVAERMEGAGLADFYGMYLVQRVQQAAAKVQRR